MLIEKKPELKSALETINGHIFYSFQDPNKYLENAITYVVSGIEQGSHILMVENQRFLSLLQQKLKPILNKEQLSRIHYTNNFDFYFTNGTFNPVVVFDHFAKSLKPHLERSETVRTWGHVEWRDLQDAYREVEQYEQNIDKLIVLNDITSVCAYRTGRITKEFKNALLQCHQFFMTDDEIVLI
ncbi:MEDS domain-containing protein [Domibacillus sp. DTU_2020_1001157_1_SI_ALB_TIR_016]|uniref:MEDS domain-containing protein n=1 Tax=Domibacillus sp. DTU_2020_1001157_1_SI_ALB_TIR_016 TaxID=3077789 RepID=UPI0028ED90BB|nr:MEDS domain-containing protein [Domibacillus sp. DTU_2020_1001157_1_SI_ALB_TIR_016]WNS77785.1 MEDS domain-containing protein [Domibacillus sp. DTU_2020_1001157_1_SI_ALB_TIR_016]